MKQIIQELKKAEKVEITDNFFKHIGSLELGDNIKIEWKDGLIDYGYCFGLPDTDIENCEFMIHIPNPDDVGCGPHPEVFVHSYNIALDRDIKKITKIMTKPK